MVGISGLFNASCKIPGKFFFKNYKQLAKKFWRIKCHSPNPPKLFTAKNFYYTVLQSSWQLAHIKGSLKRTSEITSNGWNPLKIFGLWPIIRIKKVEGLSPLKGKPLEGIHHNYFKYWCYSMHTGQVRTFKAMDTITSR